MSIFFVLLCSVSNSPCFSFTNRKPYPPQSHMVWSPISTILTPHVYNLSKRNHSLNLPFFHTVIDLVRLIWWEKKISLFFFCLCLCDQRPHMESTIFFFSANHRLSPSLSPSIIILGFQAMNFLSESEFWVLEFDMIVARSVCVPIGTVLVKVSIMIFAFSKQFPSQQWTMMSLPSNKSLIQSLRLLLWFIYF